MSFVFTEGIQKKFTTSTVNRELWFRHKTTIRATLILIMMDNSFDLEGAIVTCENKLMCDCHFVNMSRKSLISIRVSSEVHSIVHTPGEYSVKYT